MQLEGQITMNQFQTLHAASVSPQPAVAQPVEDLQRCANIYHMAGSRTTELSGRPYYRRSDIRWFGSRPYAHTNEYIPNEYMPNEYMPILYIINNTQCMDR